MIILVFGKSGSGKSYLSKKLANDLDSSIHIDLDLLNSDLMKSPAVIEYAMSLFGASVIKDGILSKEHIYNTISSNTATRHSWEEYMKQVCNDFLVKYIAATHFDYYIIDHLRANMLKLDFQPIIKIECVCDDATRISRLNTRDNISNSELTFRDQGYVHTSADLTYNSDNYLDILSAIIQS